MSPAIKIKTDHSVFMNLFLRKEISLTRTRGFFASSNIALFFNSNAIAGFISVTTLLLTGHSLTSLNVFTLMSILSNIKLFVTIYIGECLRYIADARTACGRMQNLIEKKSVLAYKMDNRHQSSPLQVYCKGRSTNPNFLEMTASDLENRPWLVFENVTKQRITFDHRRILQTLLVFGTIYQNMEAYEVCH